MRTILLSKTDRVAGALDIPQGITSIVGGGGKTTLMLRLARELSGNGARVIVTTSTHILPPAGISTQDGSSLREVISSLERDRLICLGSPAKDGKLRAPAVPLDELPAIADYVFVEADGAKGFPLKAPAEHEPVIPAATKLVVAVAGLSGIGQTIREAAFRPALYAALLGTDERHRLTAGDLARVLAHPNGQRKGVRPHMRFSVLFNQADDAARTRDALEAALLFEQDAVECAVIAALQSAE